ncbi:hypothetical protein AK830_g1690 [Neonectria ditissima]|uniref:Uncharacterized protein n=1 Tax=Neonectria ditissima TaxID=78410 RepID=A0A0P7BWF3_9HYPO|nr:hypothetical protein AK830_g1690 [Neonectria ditissima]
MCESLLLRLGLGRSQALQLPGRIRTRSPATPSILSQSTGCFVGFKSPRSLDTTNLQSPNSHIVQTIHHFSVLASATPNSPQLPHIVDLWIPISPGMGEDEKNLGISAPEGNDRVSSNGKGKGKEEDASSGSSNSMTARLQASGRLALNAVTGGPDLAGQRVGEKGTTSFSSIDRASSTVGETSSNRSRTAGIGESIRMQSSLDSSTASQAFNDFLGSESSLGFEPHRHQQAYQPETSIDEQERSDGAAVVNFLNEPSDELDSVLVGAHSDTTDDDDLTPEAASKLRETLFNSAHLESRWDDMLNFTPGFLGQPAASTEEVQLHMGTQDVDEARSIWLQQWDDVLSSYTDQVWGDLEPLAAEARREVEQLTSSEAMPDRSSETKALDRLRQILAHVRGH